MGQTNRMPVDKYHFTSIKKDSSKCLQVDMKITFNVEPLKVKFASKTNKNVYIL